MAGHTTPAAAPAGPDSPGQPPRRLRGEVRGGLRYGARRYLSYGGGPQRP